MVAVIGGRVEDLVRDLISKMSKNSFSRRTVLCINLLFAGGRQVESSTDIDVSAFCSFIGDEQRALLHTPHDWTRRGVNPL
jgi:hypothetical protein